uniref:Uncharacterized protein n=1 Tax=Siphoviridae sp. ctoRD1 TaxID=2825669 RepID=A0A8S5QEX1_9CAUD|nr:MAG TPA: hypothetical protein [Siphoviridae sp. ctoRD1]
MLERQIIFLINSANLLFRCYSPINFLLLLLQTQGMLLLLMVLEWHPKAN